MTNNLKAIIVDGIKLARGGNVLFDEIFSAPGINPGKNEFLFFIKPEITAGTEKVRLEEIIGHILDKIEAFSFNIHNIISLSAPYLKKYNIIAKHYGIINQIASNAKAHLSDSAKEKFQEIFGIQLEDANALGGLEFIEKNSNYDANSLSDLWRSLEYKKLGGGTYCAPINTGEGYVYLFNGFHPRQIDHFTRSGSNVVVFTLSGDIKWSVARNDFIGATNPQKANKNSLRRDFLEHREEFGLAEVSDSYNGVHLSAGPVEALAELQRFNSNFSFPTGVKGYNDFRFGRVLENEFGDRLDKIVGNSITVDFNGKTTSIYDITEEKDSDEAIEILKNLL
jgi:hypothetical protein